MFTGIVEELGAVAAVERGRESARLTVHGPRVAADATRGASISVNGVCLTVTGHDPAGLTMDVMAETLRRSNLGDLDLGSAVNLERAMPADGRFGGHVVQGHVDGVGRIVDRRPGERWVTVTVDLPVRLARYVVEKGSITVDGVSLTVTEVDDGAGTFAVSLIPTTLAMTTLGVKTVGDAVNLEVDVLAKYVERLLAVRDPLTAGAGGASR